MTVNDISGKAIANLATDELSHPNPVFHGDTLFVESEVLEVRPSESKPDRGIVKVHSRAYNQDGTLVAEFKRAVLVAAQETPVDQQGYDWTLPGFVRAAAVGVLRAVEALDSAVQDPLFGVG